jgi:hypothetical protein
LHGLRDLLHFLPARIKEHVMAAPQHSSEQSGQPDSRGSEASCPPREALASLGAELLRRAGESQPALETAWDALMAAWCIQGEPIGIEQLRARIQQECGTNPQDNAFSRELVALREDGRP